MKEFLYAFMISRMIVFEISYYTLSTNKHPHFTTAANEFNRPKTDYKRCGQAQSELLKGIARKIWLKWDHKHLQELNPEEYTELIQDIEHLKTVYPHFIEMKLDETKKPYSPHINFYNIKEISMKVKK